MQNVLVVLTSQRLRLLVRRSRNPPSCCVLTYSLDARSDASNTVNFLLIRRRRASSN
jgi:hypothetical protein